MDEEAEVEDDEMLSADEVLSENMFNDLDGFVNGASQLTQQHSGKQKARFDADKVFNLNKIFMLNKQQSHKYQ